MLGSSEETPAGGVDGRSALIAVALTAAVLAALWLLDLYVLRTRVLTLFRGLPPLTPLYAFWSPLLRPSTLAFVLVATLTVGLAPALADPARIPRSTFVGVLFALALLLPWTLFLVRQPAPMLGTQFRIYPGEEFLADADRILSLRVFLANYVDGMRGHLLSRHGAHFPPGHATLLYLIRLAFGAGVFPAAVVVLVLSALAVVVAFVAIRTLREETSARTGALLLLACPSLLDYACTSMDAVFLLVATAAWWASLRAFAPDGTPARALSAGVGLLLATLFSFSTLPLGLAVLAYGLLRARGTWARAARQLAFAGVAYAAALGLVYAGTGFALWDCLGEARASGVALMASITHDAPAASWGHLSYGNLVAFLVGSGVALVAAAALRLRAGLPVGDAWSLAALGTLAVMGLGRLYFLETERIWLFAMPWVAALAVSRGAFTPGGLRVLLAAGLAQALLMEGLLYTLW